MSEYIFHRLNENVTRELKLPPLVLPVRKSHMANVFQDGRVELDLLLDELHAFLLEYPEHRARYAGAMGLLTYVVGIRWGGEGADELASHYLGLGLGYRPESLSLRVNYALSLYAAGRTEEAMAQVERILTETDAETATNFWTLAAKLYSDQGRYDRALELLNACKEALPEDNAFWTLLVSVEEKAGVAKPITFADASRGIAGPPPVEQQAPPVAEIEVKKRPGKAAQRPREANKRKPATQRFCTQCGAKTRTGESFCTRCGAPVKGGNNNA